MVGNVGYTWARTTIVPLAERYAAVAAELNRLGAQAIVPMSERAIDEMNDLIVKLTPAPAEEVVDRNYEATIDELAKVVNRFGQCRAGLLEYQKNISRHTDAATRELLGINPALLDASLPSVPELLHQVLGVDCRRDDAPRGWVLPKFQDANQVRLCTMLLLRRVHEADELSEKAYRAAALVGEPLPEQNRTIIRKLADRIRKLEAALAASPKKGKPR